MKSFIYFNLPDVPEGMGQSQLADNLQEFIDSHTEQLPNAVMDGNLLVFDKILLMNLVNYFLQLVMLLFLTFQIHFKINSYIYIY